MQGYLRKRGLRFPTWHKRFFTFSGGFITYSKSERRRSKILRRDRVVNVRYWNGKKHGMVFYLSSGRELFVRGKTEEDIDDWFDAVDAYLRYQKLCDEFHHLTTQKQLEPIIETEDEELSDDIDQNYEQ